MAAIRFGRSGPLQVFPDRDIYKSSFSGPLQVFPDHNGYPGLSGPQWLQLEYVLGACFSGPLQVFPDRDIYN